MPVARQSVSGFCRNDNIMQFGERAVIRCRAGHVDIPSCAAMIRPQVTTAAPLSAFTKNEFLLFVSSVPVLGSITSFTG